MTPLFSRRDFLKLAAALPAGMLRSHYSRPFSQTSLDSPNVLIIVFDAWSAANLSLFGYSRETVPEITALADRAIVFHNHYAGGNWTPPGTASLLTGLYPWTHRIFDAISIPDHPNLFSFFHQAGYNIQSYTHNPLADRLLRTFITSGQTHIDPETFFLAPDPFYLRLFERDLDSFKIARRQILLNDSGINNSLFLAQAAQAFQDWYYRRILDPLKSRFPVEPPRIAGSRNYFLLQDVFSWMEGSLQGIQQPFLHYYHFYPPHDPYRPPLEFSTLFDDDWHPPKKDFPFPWPDSQNLLNRLRREYDQYIRYVDQQFAALYRHLADSGILDNTWLVLTSDHGEMFERGVAGHFYITLHEPLAHIPLLIFPPGQSGRVDILERTSAVDVLPTLLHLTGQTVPSALEGRLLPPFDQNYADNDRQIFAVNARDRVPGARMGEATIALWQGDYKLSYYYGHPEMGDVPEYYELYDLANDPEELENLYHPALPIVKQMTKDLHDRLAAAESPYKPRN